MLNLNYLNMKKGLMYETIITTTNDDGLPNAAPIGVLVKKEDEITLFLYKGSNTLHNISRNHIFTVNVVENPQIFVDATISRLSDEFFTSNDNNLYLKDADAFFTAEVEKMKIIVKEDTLGKSNLTIIHAKVLEIIKLSDCPRPINRAIYGIIEALINLSRYEIADESTKMEYIAKMNEISRLIQRVGGNSEKEAFKKIQDEFHKYTILD